MSTPANDLNIQLPGIVVFDGTSGFLGRTITAGSGVTITNGDGISGNPTIALTGGSAAIDSIAVQSGTTPVTPDGSGLVTISGSNGLTTVGLVNTLTVTGIQATTSQIGVSELATTSEVTTGSSTTLVPSVSSMIGHQGICKAWVAFAGTGTGIDDSYNVTSITDNGTGDWTINITNAFTAGAHFAFTFGVIASGVTTCVEGASISTTTLRMVAFNSTTGVQVDTSDNTAMMIGDQA